MHDSRRIEWNVKEWRSLIVALAIIIGLLVAARWAPDAVWAIAHVTPYLMRGIQ